MGLVEIIKISSKMGIWLRKIKCELRVQSFTKSTVTHSNNNKSLLTGGVHNTYFS